MLSAGNPFPNFSLPNQDGKITKLSDYAGQWLVIYFYPKDDTPGCTIQGKAFTASKADFDAAGIACFRALAMLSAYRAEAERADNEIRYADGPAPQFSFLRACVLESVRLWPTTPLLMVQFW